MCLQGGGGGGGVRRGFMNLLQRSALYWRGVGVPPKSLAGQGQRQRGAGGRRGRNPPETPGNKEFEKLMIKMITR